MFSAEYISLFESESEKVLGRRKVSPSQAIEDWNDLIEKIEYGYDMSAYEFDYDLDCSRTYIQHLIDSKTLRKYPEHANFIKLIDDLDNIYKEYSIENPRWRLTGHWWTRRLLKKGTADYLHAVKKYYPLVGIEPEEIKIR
ncbi:hypothetical protein D770_23405 [Flammeovirgaceae bacterium 311]|nr:hypothetical protein D770_04100 [Flammeovirgaceae bacterium 311]AHM62920.1 hypothetical protein D770_23375 [Flammeovirgaceae bacterium 311]AHM62926.1 hypothetical protein D770_23405 [Flammeovirgaceae bacterium 311]